MYPRLLNISKSSGFFLFGARGTGKSTLLKALFPQALYLDLLLPQTFDPLLRDAQSLLAQIEQLKEPNWVIIDEVQKLPNLLDVVHYCIENIGVKFALTGSSARKLKRGQANLLAGRAFVYHLFPLTHRELGEHFSLIDAINFGTLPRLFEFEDKCDRELFLTTYAHTYLKEEVVAEQLVRSLAPFRKFLEIAAQMNGELINYSRIARDVGVDDKTVRSYYQILEDTLLGFFIEPYHKSVRKTQLGSPRFFLFDNGVRRALQGILANPLSEGNYGFGKLFEHFVISEIFRLNSYLRRNFRLYYLRTQEGSEVDLIIERPGMKTVLLEIKSAREVREEHVKELARFQASIEGSEAFCFSQDKTAKRFGSVVCLPWEQGLLEVGL